MRFLLLLLVPVLSKAAVSGSQSAALPTTTSTPKKTLPSDDDGFVVDLEGALARAGGVSKGFSSLVGAARTTLYVAAPMAAISHIIHQTTDSCGGKRQRGLLETISKVRGGEALTGPARARKDAGILFSAAVDTVIEAAVLLLIVKAGAEASSFLLGRAGGLEEAAAAVMLFTWTAVVFLSGFVTKAPRLWGSNALINVDEPIDRGTGWYARLRRPRWHPPQWVFPVAWIPLKILQAFACYHIWANTPSICVLSPPVVGYAVYKALGDTWNTVFFERRLIGWGAVVIGVYWVSCLVAVSLFAAVNEKAAMLFAPTAAWVAVASLLNLSIYRLNRPASLALTAANRKGDGCVGGSG